LTTPAPGPTGWVVAPQKPTNGFAVAGLVFGIVGGCLFGLIFGILGLFRASKVGGRGRTLSWIGIGLSVLWVAGIAVSAPALKVEFDRLNNPACDSALAAQDTVSGTIIDANSNLGTIEVTLRAAIADIQRAEAQSTNAEATSAMRAIAADYQELFDAVLAGQRPAAGLGNRIDVDGQALNRACGSIR
jgi:hypothetical protein